MSQVNKDSKKNTNFGDSRTEANERVYIVTW